MLNLILADLEMVQRIAQEALTLWFELAIPFGLATWRTCRIWSSELDLPARP